MLKDETIKLLAETYFNTLEELPAWAIKCLENGYDSKSLRILASMSKWDAQSEIDNYFQRSLRELNLDQIEEPDYLLRYAEILAREIIEDKTDAIKASQNIYRILVELDYPDELHDWFEVDEMIFDYHYFLKTGDKGHFFREKEELVSKIKQVSKDLLKSK